MKNILVKSILLAGIAVLLLVPVIWQFNAGHLDTYYTRLTTERAPSMVIGSSRAAQALQPKVFHDIAPEMQNFAFTILHTPFGPAYYELIKKKLKPDTQNGLYLIAVDPWSVSALTPNERDPEHFRENKVFTSKIKQVNSNPNLEYILRYYDKPFYYAFAKEMYDLATKGVPDSKLHKDGWLEINVPVDSASVRKRIKNKLQDYHQYVREAFIHPVRLQSLEQTISLLNKHGEVFLVRLPVSKEMAAIETKYAPNFDNLLNTMATKHNIRYLNYFPESGQHLTIDGNHLHKESGKLISSRIYSEIKQESNVAATRRK